MAIARAFRPTSAARSASSGTVSNGTPDFTDGYSYDNLGNMTGITQTSQDLSDANGVATKYVALGYDADSRLTGVSYFVPGTTNVIAASTYTYDHASRLTDLSYVRRLEQLLGLL